MFMLAKTNSLSLLKNLRQLGFFSKNFNFFKNL
jgi:hypothetical protein